MKAHRKELIKELLHTLALHLSYVLPADQKLGKGLRKTIHELADQLLRAQFKQKKQAAQVVSDTSQVARQLTQTLTAALDTHLDAPAYAGHKATRVIAASAEDLAEKLVKLKRKQEKKDSQDQEVAEAGTPSVALQAAPMASLTPVAQAKRSSRRTPPQKPRTSN